jgi:polynucleotide 5'-kinase involved in rRNA processing
VGLKLTGHPAVDIYWEILYIKKGNMESVIDVSKEVGLYVNAEKTKHIFVSLHQNAEQKS